MAAFQGFSYIHPDGTLTLQGLRMLSDMEDRIRAAETKLAAIAAVVSPTGGATVDAEARAAVVAIIAGAA